MATYNKGRNELVTCPYNPAHRVLKGRMQNHLAKCKKDHMDSDLEVCPFNAVHRVPKHSLKDHLAKCDSRLVLDKKLATDPNDTFKGRLAVPSYHQPVPPCSEYWDDDMSSKVGYIPQNSARKGQLLPDLGLTKPAERKKLYKSLHQMSDDDDDDNKAKQNFNNNVNNNAETNAKDNVSRQPRQSYKEGFIGKSEIERPYIGLGRGVVKNSERRIAANIFGSGDAMTLRQPESVQQAVASMSKLNIGLGRGQVLPSSRPGYEDNFPPL